MGIQKNWQEGFDTRDQGLFDAHKGADSFLWDSP
jgi:hypothetical protein